MFDMNLKIISLTLQLIKFEIALYIITLSIVLFNSQLLKAYLFLKLLLNIQQHLFITIFNLVLHCL